MLYVLADEHGIYHYDPTTETVGHTGKSGIDFAVADAIGTDARTDPFGGRPPGALVIVFPNAADGFKFGKAHMMAGERVPSRRFNPRPARAEDNLGPTVCFPEGNTRDDYKFRPAPTPPDACESVGG